MEKFLSYYLERSYRAVQGGAASLANVTLPALTEYLQAAAVANLGLRGDEAGVFCGFGIPLCVNESTPLPPPVTGAERMLVFGLFVHTCSSPVNLKTLVELRALHTVSVAPVHVL